MLTGVGGDDELVLVAELDVDEVHEVAVVGLGVGGAGSARWRG